MRFDDSLETVLSADMSTPFGAQSAWRQLVDLIGRRRVPADADAIARLKALRPKVPPPVRAASARSVSFANPPPALVRLFADDEIAIAMPVLRVAQLESEDWIEMLPALSPAGRSILRHRRDLSPAVKRSLASFGSVDFVLPAADLSEVEPIAAEATTALSGPVERGAADVEPLSLEDSSAVDPNSERSEQVEATETRALAAADEAGAAALSDFVSIANVAMGLPVVAEALRQSVADPDERSRSGPTIELIEPIEAVVPTESLSPRPASIIEAAQTPMSRPEAAAGTFQVAELLARIDAYQRQREGTPSNRTPSAPEIQSELFNLDQVHAESFRFETDAAGTVRWIEGASRAPLIGLSLDLAAMPNGSRVDGVAAGAFRRRAGFANARLVVDGTSGAAGQWRITGVPVFDRASGRFSGYRGSARRPRADESAEPMQRGRNPASDALRQLVHELRTPTNAIAGFAEMIESQMLGPVSAAYRAHAAAIRSQADGLLTAIDDIDMAARIESSALDLRPGEVPLAPLLTRVADDLAPLATLRGTTIAIYPGPDELVIAGDERAVDRLIGRLMATLVASGSAGERIAVAANCEADGIIAVRFDRPRALAAYAGDRLLTIDAEAEAEREGAPLLGTGFAVRLARNLAGELRGDLAIGDKTLTLRLPAAVSPGVEQVFSS